MPKTAAAPARRAVLAALGAGGLGMAAACTAPAAGGTTKPAGTKTAPKATPKPAPKATAKPAPKPTPKPTPTATPKPTATPTKSATPTATPTPTSTPTTPAPTPTAIVGALPNLVGTDAVWHLVRRTTFGATPALVAEVKTMGATAWLNQQLAPAGIDDSACDAYLTRYPTLPMTTPQIRTAIDQFSWDAMFELGKASIARALFSRRQLFEVMVEFWSNHFNIATPSGDVWDLKTVDDREVIRKNALGSFSDMLIASAKSPAMLRYLDNADSSVDTLNENYGRELLELHTVGIEAGYTHDDVIDSARILTGYTVGRHGEFAYYNDWRYIGPVQVLGFSSANSDGFDGLHVAEQYLRYLATHPSTARHLATKLAIRFVSDSPPASLITNLASVYLANNTAIVPVLKALFASSEFTASIGQKTRRPLEDIIGAARAIGVTPAAGDATSLASLYWVLGSLAQAPLAWHPPNGYPDVAAAWLSAGGELRRWNSHLGIAGAWWTDGMATPALTTLLPTPQPATIGALVDALAVRLLGVKLAGGQRTAVIAFACSRGSSLTEASSSANTIKYDLNALVTLILNAPNWSQR